MTRQRISTLTSHQTGISEFYNNFIKKYTGVLFLTPETNNPSLNRRKNELYMCIKQYQIKNQCKPGNRTSAFPRKIITCIPHISISSKNQRHKNKLNIFHRIINLMVRNLTFPNNLINNNINCIQHLELLCNSYSDK